MGGRKRTPSAVLKAAGYPGHNPKRMNVPATPNGHLLCPDYFSDEERSIWDYLVPNLPQQVVKPADVETLIAYVEMVAIKRQAMRELRTTAEDMRKEDGTTQCMTVETERGWVKNPVITVLDSCAKNIVKLGSELGLTPASRERLTVEKKKESTLKELLTGESACSIQQKPN